MINRGQSTSTISKTIDGPDKRETSQMMDRGPGQILEGHDLAEDKLDNTTQAKLGGSMLEPLPNNTAQ